MAHAEMSARRAEAAASRHVADLLARAGVEQSDYDEAMECMRVSARVAVHFHPDRLGATHRTVAESLLDDGLYRSQFETGLSGGSVSAYPGGERDQWENRLFGGAYNKNGVTNAERPKYGALELVRHPDGPIPRFGSCYFVLRQQVSHRTSFTFMGSESALSTERPGTLGRMRAVMAPLLAEISQGGTTAPPWPPFRAPTLGVPRLTVPLLLAILRELPLQRLDVGNGMPGRVRDTCIEAQVHGPIDFARDVELLVADPAFSATETGDVLRAISRRYAVHLQWHCGFRLAANDVPDDFRGPEMPRIARRIADPDGIVDAAVIGKAAAAMHRDPSAWIDRGTVAEASQHLKQLWHVLVHYGSPASHRPTGHQM